MLYENVVIPNNRINLGIYLSKYKIIRFVNFTGKVLKVLLRGKEKDLDEEV